MKQKQLKKLIEKEYKKNHDHLYITVAEDWWCNPKNRCAFDIVLTDKIGKEFSNYLFSIYNLSFSDSIDFKATWSYFRPFNKKDMFKTSNLVNFAHYPLYMNQQFILKKFTNITQEDIHNCTKYLIRKILNCYLIFNIHVIILKKGG